LVSTSRVKKNECGDGNVAIDPFLPPGGRLDQPTRLDLGATTTLSGERVVECHEVMGPYDIVVHSGITIKSATFVELLAKVVPPAS